MGSNSSLPLLSLHREPKWLYQFRFHLSIKEISLEINFIWYERGQKILEEMPRGTMAEVVDCALEVNEFEFQSGYVHFRTNKLGEGMNPLIPQLSA